MEYLSEIAIGLFCVGAFGGFWLALFRKAGYETRPSVLMTIGMFVPLVNLGIAVYFMFAHWPVEDALSVARARAGIATEDDAVSALSRASRLESRGDSVGAIAKYEEIVRRFEGTEIAKDAEISIQNLKAKIGGF